MTLYQEALLAAYIEMSFISFKFCNIDSDSTEDII